MARSSRAEFIQRIHEVEKLLIHGASFADLLQFAAENKWEIRARQLRNYVRLAERHMAKTLNKDREQLFARHIRTRRLIMARALKMQDLRVALQAARDEAELIGLYPPTRVAPTTPDGREPYAIEQLRDLANQLQAAINERSTPQPAALLPYEVLTRGNHNGQ